jgi:hypothetical protein
MMESWGKTGRIRIVRRDYAMYDEIIVDGHKRIGAVWKRPNDGWRAGLWFDSGTFQPEHPAMSRDEAIYWLLEQNDPELLEQERRGEESKDS